MAEIEIEKKKPIWPWILLAVLIIAALLYFFVWADDDADDVDDMDNTEQVMEEDNTMDNETVEYGDSENMGYGAAIGAYDTYIQNPNMGMDHEYANNALLELITAVKATADEVNVNVDADLQKAKSQAEAITEDPMKVTHANKIKDAGETILKALKTIQNEKFPNLSSAYSEADSALAKIKPDVETLNQKAEVKSFFDKVSSLLNSMK